MKAALGWKMTAAGGAYLVVFDTFEGQMWDIYGDNTTERISRLFENLDMIFKGDDGRIYVSEELRK